VSQVLSRLAEGLRGQAENLILMESIDSTHAMALRLIEQMEDEGLDLVPTLLLSRDQSHGRGRAERSWSSPRGGLYLNWLCSGVASGVIPLLPMLAAASAHQAVTQLGVDEVAIKWPNDLLVGGAKLAGVLIHARSGEPTWATIGLGVNLDLVPDLGEGRPATAISEHAVVDDWPKASIALVASFVQNLTAALDQPTPALELWKDRLLHSPGDRMTVHLGSGEVVAGSFLGLTDEGFLRLAGPDGEIVVSSGDVFETLER
jgi:BirA family biotin operon repressor/biotin-[acetyl-CoA-carboxylase] ligase